MVDPTEAVSECGSDMKKRSQVCETGEGDVAKSLVLEDFTRIVGSELRVLQISRRRNDSETHVEQLGSGPCKQLHRYLVNVVRVSVVLLVHDTLMLSELKAEYTSVK